MLIDLLVNFGLLAMYFGATAAVIWILSGIPFVRKTVKRCWWRFDSINDKMDEAMGYYETWRQ